MAKIAVIYYSTYGHITKLTESVVEGAKSTGAQVDLFQIPETLSEEILAKQHAIPRPDIPVITGDKLEEYDGFIFGFPTRYGRAPAQVSAFFDSTGKQWAAGKLVGKCATVYTSVASQHGGLETTALTTMPFFIHHGIAYVPPGYSHPELTKLDEIIGGSAYGAGTVAGGDGSRQPVESDLNVAKHQGSYFAGFVNNLVAGKAK
ncbi:benzoquinone reductase [Cystobasidium minutum MCA 4210]|uniref:benzoquinone reductase n=1 Tax=Cystobasidium minutum MCA 4210 TaxID=1397322 RepID=UPI0034CD3FB7|eukprot:jgi/Rhomi1/170706/fgenesh1_kg.4_\